MFRWHYVKYDGDGVWECGATGDLPIGNWVDCFDDVVNELDEREKQCSDGCET